MLTESTIAILGEEGGVHCGKNIDVQQCVFVCPFADRLSTLRGRKCYD